MISSSRHLRHLWNGVAHRCIYGFFRSVARPFRKLGTAFRYFSHDRVSPGRGVSSPGVQTPGSVYRELPKPLRGAPHPPKKRAFAGSCAPQPAGNWWRFSWTRRWPGVKGYDQGSRCQYRAVQPGDRIHGAGLSGTTPNPFTPGRERHDRFGPFDRRTQTG
jgi:hypothetical protein